MRGGIPIHRLENGGDELLRDVPFKKCNRTDGQDGEQVWEAHAHQGRSLGAVLKALLRTQLGKLSNNWAKHCEPPFAGKSLLVLLGDEGDGGGI